MKKFNGMKKFNVRVWKDIEVFAEDRDDANDTAIKAIEKDENEFMADATEIKKFKETQNV